MAKKLVRVARSKGIPTSFPNLIYRAHPEAINPREVVDNDRDREWGDGQLSALAECEFFFIEEEDTDTIVTELARVNPGKEIQVYDLSRVSVCPAGEMVTKKVTKEGVLPG
jgi:hypothetical protein